MGVDIENKRISALKDIEMLCISCLQHELNHIDTFLKIKCICEDILNNFIRSKHAKQK